MIVYLGKSEGLGFGTWHLEGLLVWLTMLYFFIWMKILSMFAL